MKTYGWMIACVIGALAGLVGAQQAEERRARDEVERARQQMQEVEIRTRQLQADQEEQIARLVAQARADADRAKAAARLWRDEWGDVMLEAMDPSRTEKAAFLGVSASPVTGTLREQLRLPAGVGLVVDHVAKDSPAEAAGLRRHDVLHKINDQVLINAHQLAVLVRTYRPGDEVKITFYREGQSQTATARLVEKEVPALDENTPWGPIRILRDRVFDLAPDTPRPPIPFTSKGRVSRSIDDDGERVTFKDEDYELKMRVRDGKRELEAFDRSGRSIFKGPIDTEEQRSRLPEAVRQRLRTLDRVRELREFKSAESSTTSSSTSTRSVSWSDEQHTLQLTVRRKNQEPAKTTLKVTDADGREIFNGPIDTAEQRQALPEAIRKKMESPTWKTLVEELAVDPAK